MAQKRDPQQEAEALDWMEAVLGEKLSRSEDYGALLKDGIILCRLINKLAPDSVKKIIKKGGAFALRQNSEAFQQAATKYGVPANETFQTVDLWEQKNIPQVTLCIFALGRISQKKPDSARWPILGPKMADKNVREFTDEQMRAGEHIHSLQYGSNLGATQAGQNMGKRRNIND